MIVRRTAPEEASRVNELFAVAFETSAEKGPADPGNEGIRHWAAFSDQGEMMSTLSVSDFTVTFDGQACKMGGVGGVATLPQYRRQGGIRACFTRMLPELYRNGYAFSYLFPFSTGYYRKFGYESCVTKTGCTLDLGLLPRLPGGDFRLSEPGATLAESIRTVDALWERRYNMAVRHGPEDYAWAEKPDPFRTASYTYVCFGADGSPTGYTSFRTENQLDGRNLVCSRFCFTGRDGFYTLLALFQSLAADHRYAKFDLPSEPALWYLLPEWSLGAVAWAIKPAGMVRAVNVKAVLERAAVRGSGALVLRILDPLIPENDGSWEIRFENDRVLSVQNTQASPDAQLEISAFSALIAGVCDFSQAAQWMPGVKALRPDMPLNRLFYPKPLMICDYF